MKKTYLLIPFVLCFTIYSQAQFLMKSNSHMLRTGDEHYFNIANNVDPGSAGANQVWDFHDLTTTSSLTSYMYGSYNTANSADIPEADAVLEENGTKFYFKVSEGIIEQYGSVSQNTMIKYDKPFVKMVFPFNFGDTYSGDFSGTIEGPNNYTSTFSGNYFLEADAFGTLILPNQVKYKHVLRIKTVREQCSQNNTSCNCSTISYKWYSQDVRYPLLTIIQNQNSTGTNTIQTAYYSKAENSGDDSKHHSDMLSDQIEVRIYPNPFNSEFKLDYSMVKDSDVMIEIYDNSGKKVNTIQKLNQKAGYYTESITSNDIGDQLGMYHIRIIAGDCSISKTVIRGE